MWKVEERRKQMRIDKAGKECCGCTACESVCPHGAIAMRPDALGFLYPYVDGNKCVDCGLCVKVCAFHTGRHREMQQAMPVPYAVRNRDEKEVMTSHSGGAFIALSNEILRKSGVVYGVGYGGRFRIVHERATNKSGCDGFKGSKYVQSDLQGIFRRVRSDLSDGKIVLFSGTPCQTAGLYSYLKVKPDLLRNLWLVDVICHGVAAPAVWKDYLDYLERKERKKIVAVNFRDKGLTGWRSHTESFKFEDGVTRTYPYLFYNDVMLRPSCNVCPYACLQRPSDLTIGDFWGVEDTCAASMGEDNKGCSLVLVNTEKGKVLFDAVRTALRVMEVCLDDCLQPNLQSPTPCNPQQGRFARDYAEKGFAYVRKKYGNDNWKCRARRWVSNLVPDKVRPYVKRMIGRI